MSTTLIVYCSCQHQSNHKNSMEVILVIWFSSSPSLYLQYVIQNTLHHLNININITTTTCRHPIIILTVSLQYTKQNAYTTACCLAWNMMLIPLYSITNTALEHIQVSQSMHPHLLGPLYSPHFSPPPAPLLRADLLHRPQRGTVGSLRKLQADSLHAMEMEPICIYSHLFIYIYIVLLKAKE